MFYSMRINGFSFQCTQSQLISDYFQFIGTYRMCHVSIVFAYFAGTFEEILGKLCKVIYGNLFVRK